MQPNTKWRFEGTCGACDARITGDTGTWRHDVKPDEPHRPYASGVIAELSRSRKAG